MIRRPLWGHNETPFGRPTPGRPIGLSAARGLATLRACFVFLVIILVLLFLNMVCRTVALPEVNPEDIFVTFADVKGAFHDQAVDEFIGTMVLPGSYYALCPAGSYSLAGLPAGWRGVHLQSEYEFSVT
jgi:hypothetical protein